MRDYKSAGTGSRPGLSSGRSTARPRRAWLAAAAAILALGIAAALLLRGPNEQRAEEREQVAVSESTTYPNAIPLKLPPPAPMTQRGPVSD